MVVRQELVCAFFTNSVRNPAGTADSSLGRQIRHCHLVAEARVAFTWAVPGPEVPAGRACFQLRHSLDWEEFISEEDLWISDKHFSILKRKTNSC